MDDERRLVTALQRGLAAEGFRVEVSYDGITGQELAERGDFDVIILDIMMPGRNGYQVCRALRDQGNTTPILMLTAKDGQKDETEALNTGADDYLTKPFHYSVLVARLRALVRRSSTPQKDRASQGHPDEEDRALLVGNLEIRPGERRCYRGRKEVHLTAKEFDILLLLARKAGTVVSKETLIDELWDFAAPAAPNVIEVHVSALRRKVDAPFGQASIQTVRGSGYRLVEST